MYISFVLFHAAMPPSVIISNGYPLNEHSKCEILRMLLYFHIMSQWILSSIIIFLLLYHFLKLTKCDYDGCMGFEAHCQASFWRVYTATAGWFARLLPLSVILTSDFPGQGGWGIPMLQPRLLRWEFPQPESILSKLHTGFSVQVEKQPADFQIPDSTAPRETDIWFPVSICIGFQKELIFPPCVNLRHQVPCQHRREKMDNVKDDAKLTGSKAVTNIIWYQNIWFQLYFMFFLPITVSINST